jgi:hypothetical protein
VNIPFMIGLGVVFVFAIGVLIGQGLNGRAQIAHDKRHAKARRELDDRVRALAITGQVIETNQSEPF